MLVEKAEDAQQKNIKLRLSFSRDTLSESLRAGDEVVFRGKVQRASNYGNPEEFDYVEYLSARGISGRAFVRSGCWRLLRRYEDGGTALSLVMDWRVSALLWRDRLLDVYRNAGLQGETLALFSALTLGDKSGLSEELKDVYSGVGVSHVLALSGMHLSFFAVILNFFLLNYFRRRCWRWIGVSLAVMLIWGYTFLAGLPASLVRAALMYSAMLAGSCAGRSGFSVNSLALSALLMLCINPLWFYDVGFQLSFLAMLGILTICPRFQGHPLLQWPYARWIPQSLLVSFAAQLFTIPLVAYRFGTFSPYSAWATLLISPLTALLIYGMPLLLLAGITGCGTAMLAWCIGWLGRLQNGCLRAIMDWPYALVHTDWSWWLAAWCYIVLCIWIIRPFRSLATRLKAGLIGGILTLCAFIANGRFTEVQPGIVFYNNPRCPSVHVVYSSGRSYLFPVWPDSVPRQMSYIAESFWAKKLSAPPIVVSDDFRDGYISSTQGLVAGRNGISFLVLADNRWEGVRGRQCAKLCFLYVCRGFRGSLSELSSLFHPRCVVLDGSLWQSDRERYVEECRALGWKYYDMEDKGALKVALN